jgi:hypothetical protein
MLRPLLAEFARSIAGEVERLTLERVREALSAAVSGVGHTAGRARTRRATVLCYFPGCRNVAAPRFGMFCAAEHKKLPAGDKEKYRKQHLAAVAKETGVARRA